MKKGKTGITSDCVCDLPQRLLNDYGIEVIPFHIRTESGCFSDITEITSDNVLEYIAEGHKPISSASTAEEYRAFFEKQLKKHDKLIHITITSGMSLAFENACRAAEELNGNVTVIDSMHLSTGMGQIVIQAARLAEYGKSTEEIIDFITELRERVSTSFIAYSADCLYLNGKISRATAAVCKLFSVHPVLTINRNGQMKLGGVYVGNYENAAKKYIAKRLKGCTDIDRSCLFITHAGCSTKLLSLIRYEVERYNRADKIEITTASSTVSSNCGPSSFGVLFVHTKKQ